MDLIKAWPLIGYSKKCLFFGCPFKKAQKIFFQKLMQYQVNKFYIYYFNSMGTIKNYVEVKSWFGVNTTKVINYQIGNFILAAKWVNPTLFSYHKIKTFFKSGEPLCLAPFRCFPRCFCLESKKATDGSVREKQSMFRKNVDVTELNRYFRHWNSLSFVNHKGCVQ